MRLEDPHRPYVDDVAASRAPSAAGAMTRVPEVIDVWFDSGCMPFAQWHAPHENEDVFEQRFPADYICEAIDQTRGWFYSLLAVATLLFDRSAYEQRRLPRPASATAKARRCRSPRATSSRPGTSWTASAPTRCAGTSSPPSSRGTATASRSTPSARRAAVPQAALEHLHFLRPLRERRRRAAPARPDGRRGHRARPLGPLAARRDGRDRHRAARGLRRDDRRPRDRRVRRRSLQLVRAPLAAALLGGRPRRLRDAARLPRHRRASCSRRSRRSSPTRSTTTSTAPSRRCTSATGPSPARATSELESAMASRARRSASGSARAARRRSSCASRCARPSSSRPGASATAIERLSDVVREELNVKALRFVDEADELGSYEVKPNYRTLGPRFGKRDAAGRGRHRGARPRARRRRAARGARPSGHHRRHDHELAADDLHARDAARSTATSSSARARTPSRSSSCSTTPCAARASPARSSTRSRTPARRPASPSRTGSRSRSRATRSCSARPACTSRYVTGETLATPSGTHRQRRRRARDDRGPRAADPRRARRRRLGVTRGHTGVGSSEPALDGAARPTRARPRRDTREHDGPPAPHPSPPHPPRAALRPARAAASGSRAASRPAASCSAGSPRCCSR